MTDELEKYRQTWQGQLNRGILEFVCLLLLQNEKHGYHLVQIIRSNLVIAKEINDGPIYALLSRLKEKGCLVSRKLTEESRKRKYYSLTPLGEQYLELMKIDWKDLRNAVNELCNNKSYHRS